MENRSEFMQFCEEISAGEKLRAVKTLQEAAVERAQEG
jgi:hypothetical protein